MTVWVALLRGINVGRAKQVPMADLSAAYEQCGCRDVRTVLRSGNVVFGHDGTPDAAVLEAALLGRTGVPSSTLLLGGAELLDVAAANPLLLPGRDPSRLFVGFMSARPDTSVAPVAASLAPEELVVGERAVYQWCPDGSMASRVSASFWRQVAPLVTVRNVRTVDRLAELVRAAAPERRDAAGLSVGRRSVQTSGHTARRRKPWPRSQTDRTPP